MINTYRFKNRAKIKTIFNFGYTNLQYLKMWTPPPDYLRKGQYFKQILLYIYVLIRLCILEHDKLCIISVQKILFEK